MGRIKDITGKVFFGMEVIGDSGERNKSGEVLWLCKCPYCKEVKTKARKYDLERGDYKSCGCKTREFISLNNGSRTHGMAGTKEYEAWRGMIKRCTLRNNPSAKYYKDRGISVCEEWFSSFETFYHDMGDSPSSTHSLDRIDNDGNYCRDNCRWATKSEQACNRRKIEGCTSKVIGIYCQKRTGKFIARFCPVNRHTRLYIGTFDTEQEAIDALEAFKENYHE